MVSSQLARETLDAEYPVSDFRSFEARRRVTLIPASVSSLRSAAAILLSVMTW
jgi:hypothetical protein